MSDISKQDLYESVKALVETDSKHIQLGQHKLFTLVTIGFQYLLYHSTKNPGAYIIRIENAKLADKLARKSKDQSTRKFIQQLLIPRKIKFNKSMIYLDFFNINSWNMTAEIPREKIKGALIVKDTADKPMDPMLEAAIDDEDQVNLLAGLPEDYYLSSLTDFVPKTITVAFEEEIEGLAPVNFPFIKKDDSKTISGVTLGSDVNWDKLD
jgi:hypothetical protein